jgi:hydrogenase expression/formation protein HypE
MIRADDHAKTRSAGTASAQRRERIALAHGGGGQLMDELIRKTMLPRLNGGELGELLDAAVLRSEGEEVAMTTDSYVVQPLCFPGGDIGRLAVCGTVNDLAVMGAQPMGLALGLILEEGLDKQVLEQVLDSIAATAREAGTRVVTGDTKVVGKGQADGMYITTTGLGRVHPGRRFHPKNVQPGDVLIINGSIGDHGLAVMLAREMPQVHSVLRSDVAPLNRMIERLISKVKGVAFMRDPTRGGVAAVAADLAAMTRWRITLDEQQIPVRPETRHAAEMLGLDPLEVANEGKVIVVVRPEDAEVALHLMRQDPLGAEASIIGRVQPVADGRCELRTTIGGCRIIQKPYGEQLPRIC